ncbi:MAG: cytochrome c4 [Rubrivivax sp.]|nr:cytochrome c4 [Rubrivivax sp.]
MKPLLARAGSSAAAPRVLAMLALAAAALLPAAAADAAKPAFKPDLAKAQTLAQPCMACHTADGSRGAPANPILQGQHADYLFKQLGEFKSGKRKNPVMQGMVASLSEDDMRHLAAFYAGKNAKPGFAKSKDTVKLGEALYRGGNMSSKLPACSGCHGPGGAGIPAQYPRLAGQHADYAEAQLTAFRNGGRANGPMMAAIAAKMSEREIKAVADYMAGLR